MYWSGVIIPDVLVRGRQDCVGPLPEGWAFSEHVFALYARQVHNIYMTSKRWTTSNKAVYNLGYHIIWCPKYRRKVLVDKVETRLKELLFEKADEIGVTIENIEVMPDHVHIFVKSTPVNAPHYIVQQFKGYTSFVLRNEFKFLKTRLPTLWTRSYYIESVGHISEETIKKYIDDQKNK
jgi:putative transposase